MTQLPFACKKCCAGATDQSHLHRNIMNAGLQDERYRQTAAQYGQAIERLARGYEADRDRRRDLVQDIHVALWHSMAGFDNRCSLRTWVYRVAHNVAASFVARSRRLGGGPQASLEDLEQASGDDDPQHTVSQGQLLQQLMTMIRRLDTMDRQVMLLYLEDMDASAMAEITGLSSGAIATRIHRIKSLLARRFRTGEHDAK